MVDVLQVVFAAMQVEFMSNCNQTNFKSVLYTSLDSCQIDEACSASLNQEGDNSHEERLSQARLLFA